MFLGIDIGSSSSKAVVLDADKKVLAQQVVNMGTGTKGIFMSIDQALTEAGLGMDDIKYSVVTGYGRMTYQGANAQITEITCHAKGVAFVAPEARTVVDIGGQDAKVISLSPDGQVNNFVMNEKCAAGTGRFLEVMARVLGCAIDELAGLAKASTQRLSISNICTVFAESEVISQLSSGAKLADVAQGAHVAIAKRVAGMAGRVGVKPVVVMTGGVALNCSLVDALAEELKIPITVPEHPQSMGALGAALFAWERFQKQQA